MLPPSAVWRRAALEIAGLKSARIGPGVEVDRPHDESAAVALALVSRVGPGGRADVSSDAPRVVGVALALPFVTADPVGARLARLVTPWAVLDFDGGWRVREVAPGVSAREVQERCPFPLRSGPDLVGWLAREP